MFADACDLAVQFTLPVVISTRGYDGECEAAIGSFVVLNQDGWILTAAHIVQLFQGLAAAKDATEKHRSAVKAIESAGLVKKERQRQVRELGKDPGGPQNFSAWWGIDNVKLVEAFGIADADIAVGRLEPFDPSLVKTYPKLKDPNDKLRIGTSLCRLGYPFYEIKPSFDDSKNMFVFPPNTLPLPIFPIEGILTRHVLVGQHQDGYPVAFIETSSPGLRGQSGGPIIDREGRVWGIQSQTRHFSLGFDPPVPGGAKSQKEHQFLNVGWGAHVETIVGMLKTRGVAFDVA